MPLTPPSELSSLLDALAYYEPYSYRRNPIIYEFLAVLDSTSLYTNDTAQAAKLKLAILYENKTRTALLTTPETLDAILNFIYKQLYHIHRHQSHLDEVAQPLLTMLTRASGSSADSVFLTELKLRVQYNTDLIKSYFYLVNYLIRYIKTRKELICPLKANDILQVFFVNDVECHLDFLPILEPDQQAHCLFTFLAYSFLKEGGEEIEEIKSRINKQLLALLQEKEIKPEKGWKEAISEYIFSLTPAQQLPLIDQIINHEDTPLSHFFWHQRGLLKPSLTRESSALGKIYIQRTQLLAQPSATEPSNTETIPQQTSDLVKPLLFPTARPQDYEHAFVKIASKPWAHSNNRQKILLLLQLDTDIKPLEGLQALKKEFNCSQDDLHPTNFAKHLVNYQQTKYLLILINCWINTAENKDELKSLALELLTEEQADNSILTLICSEDPKNVGILLHFLHEHYTDQQIKTLCLEAPINISLAKYQSATLISEHLNFLLQGISQQDVISLLTEETNNECIVSLINERFKNTELYKTAQQIMFGLINTDDLNDKIYSKPSLRPFLKEMIRDFILAQPNKQDLLDTCLNQKAHPLYKFFHWQRGSKPVSTGHIGSVLFTLHREYLRLISKPPRSMHFTTPQQEEEAAAASRKENLGL